MGEDPERIEQEIERTRAKLGADLDALEERVNPKKVAYRSVDRAKEKVAEVREKVAGTVGEARDKVAGAAAEARQKAPGAGGTDVAVDHGTTGTAADGQSGGVADKVSGLAGTAKDKAAPLAATAREKAGTLAATAKDKAAVRVGMDPQEADTREVATAAAGGAWRAVLEQTRRNPVAVGAAAFAVGYLLGR